MNFLEKDLEEIIFDNLKTTKRREQLYFRGLEFDYKTVYGIKRQLHIGNYGKADIVFLNKQICDKKEIIFDKKITIVELKKDNINLGTLLQASRYAKGIKIFLEEREKEKYLFEIILIGKNIDDNSDWVYLFDILDISNVHIYKYVYNIDGISFQKINLHDYSLTNNGFNNEN